MDGGRFDGMTRFIASRRSAIAALSALAMTGLADAEAAKNGHGRHGDCAKLCRHLFPPGDQRKTCIKQGRQGEGPCHNPPGSGMCDNCPQRGCCACEGDGPATCGYVDPSQDVGIFCTERCGPRIARSIPAAQGQANFCTTGNACVAIPCPVS